MKHGEGAFIAFAASALLGCCSGGRWPRS